MKRDEKIRFNQKFELEVYVVDLRYDSEAEIDFPLIYKNNSRLMGKNEFFSFTEIAKEFNILSVFILKDLLCIYLNTSKSHLENKLITLDMAIIKRRQFNGTSVDTFLLNRKGTNMIKNMFNKIDNLKRDNPIDLSDKLFKITEDNKSIEVESKTVDKYITDLSDVFIDDNQNLDNLITFGKYVNDLEEILPLQHMIELKYRGMLYRFLKELKYQKITTKKIKETVLESQNFIEFVVKVFDWDIIAKFFKDWHSCLFQEAPSYWANFSTESKYWKKKFKNYILNYRKSESVYKSFDNSLFKTIEENYNHYQFKYRHKKIYNIGENIFEQKRLDNYTIDQIQTKLSEKIDLYEYALLNLELIRREIFNISNSYVLNDLETQLNMKDKSIEDEEPDESFEIVWKDGFYRIIERGRLTVKHKYDDINKLGDNLYKIKVSEKYGLVNKNGEEITSIIYTEIHNFSEGLAVVEINDKFGFINERGECIILPIYEYAYNFSEGLAVVKVNDLYGYINKLGDIIIEPNYLKADNFSEGMAAVYCKNDGEVGWNSIDKNGSLVIEKYFDRSYEFNNGIAEICYNYKNEVYDFNNDESWTETEYGYYYINKDGNKIFDRDDVMWINNELNLIYLNRHKRILISTKEWKNSIIVDYNDSIIVCKNKYDYIHEFKEGFAAVELNGKYGYINSSGQEIIPLIYD